MSEPTNNKILCDYCKRTPDEAGERCDDGLHHEYVDSADQTLKPNGLRTEKEIREAHGYLMIAHQQALVDGDDPEINILAMACHALIWVLGHGMIFENIVEIAHKAQDDIDLSIDVLSPSKEKL